MSRDRTYTPLDDAPQIDGDDYFIGVKMRSPGQIPKGYVADARNTRFTNGVAEPRKGIYLLPWTNKVSAATTEIQPFSTIYGDVVFRDPNSVEWIIFAAEGKVFKTRENNGSSEVPLPPGVTITSPVEFLQCMSVLLMLRGPGLDALVMTETQSGFKTLLQAATDVGIVENQNPDGSANDGTLPIPTGAVRGLTMQNRAFILDGSDDVYPSDFLNYTRYKLRSQFRIERGADENLVAIHVYNENTFVALKDKSIHIISGVTGDLSGLNRYQVTDQYGCIAPKSVVTVGKDVWFLSNKRGVMSINQTELNKFQGVDLPQSFDIDPLVQRINWQYAAGAVGVNYGNKTYFAVPLDNAEVVKGEILNNEVYDGSGLLGVSTLVIGRTYRWTKGANETSLVNNVVTLTASGDFVAKSSLAVIHGTPNATATASLQAVFQGCNNAILVYDALAGYDANGKPIGAWSGYDSGPAIAVKDFLVATYQGELRLFIVGVDGFIGLYEEFFHDQINIGERPLRVDLVLDQSAPALISGSTVMQVNGGTLVVCESSLTNNEGVWGNADPSFAAQNLWNDLNGEGGFNPDAANFWVVPNADVTQIPGGVRFTATNGAPPVVLFFTNIGRYSGDDFVLTTWGGTEKAWIDHEVTTRAYRTVAPADLLAAKICRVHLRTWNPVYSLATQVTGVKTRAYAFQNRAKDRTKYIKPWNAAPFVVTNVNGDHDLPNREDYSVEQSGLDRYFANTPVSPDLHQETTESVRCPRAARGRNIQFILSSSQGRAELHAIGIESAAITRAMGKKP